MEVAPRGWNWKGNGITLGASGKNTALPTHYGPLGQVWERGSLLKLRALELLSTYSDTLITSSSDTLLLSRALWKSRIQESYCGTRTTSIPVLFYRGSCRLFSSFNGPFLLPLPTFGDQVCKSLEDRLTFSSPLPVYSKDKKMWY